MNEIEARVRAAEVGIRTAAIEWHYLADQPGGEAKVAALHAAVEEWSAAMDAWAKELGGDEPGTDDFDKDTDA